MATIIDADNDAAMHKKVLALEALVKNAIPGETGIDVITETLVTMLARVLIYGAVDPREAVKFVASGLTLRVDEMLESAAEEKKLH